MTDRRIIPATPQMFAHLLSMTCAIGLFWSAPVLASPDDDPIAYSRTTPIDAITRLQKQMDSGAVKLAADPEHGYLESVLKNLTVPASSQGLVLAKTSFQANLITPHRPRAVYFNDETYVGYVQGGSVLEFVTIDPNLGAVFYLMKQHTAKPKFVRQNYECMQCHLSENTQSVPGLLMRSVYSDLEGQPIQSAGTFITSDRSPFSERYGGWYVTGKYGNQHHMGNMTCDDDGHPDDKEFSQRANLTTLSDIIKTTPYPRDTSDVVALMVLGHQQHLHNLMTSTNYYVRTALRDMAETNKEAGVPPMAMTDSTQLRINGACDMLVRALLFSREAPIAEPITGSSGFAEEFSARGPKDSQGRSLRDFDLTHRLFKYPCSYLIYSDQFNGLPTEAKNAVYHRLWDVLSGKDKSPAYSHLSSEDRAGILRILGETKKDLPEYWTAK